MKKTAAKKGNPELIEALNAIEKEKDISKEILLEAIENSLVAACKNEYGKADNIRVNLDRETGEFHVYQDKVVVEEVEDAMLEMSQTEAEVKYPGTGLGETVSIEVTPKNFGRIAAQKAKQVVVQKIREEERKVLFEQYYDVILKPVITEKSMADMADKKYTFLVHTDANKTMIKDAVEKMFEGTKVASVNTMNLDGKKKRRGRTAGTTSKTKKAIVQLTADSKEIEIFEGL